MADILKPTISLFLICLIVTAALAFTYVGTKDVIAERVLLDAEAARKEVLAGVDSFEPAGDFSAITAAKPELGIVKEAYKAVKGGSTAGYVFSVDSKGYGGDVRVTVGIGNDGEITGVKIGDNKETPGLGSKASDQPFISQFKDIVPKAPLKVVKNNKANPEDIDAISGATITSRAVVKAVQAAVDMAAEFREKEGSSK